MDMSVMEVDAPAPGDAPSQMQQSINPHIENLYSNNAKKCFHAVVELKFAVIGSPKSKANVIMQGCVARLLQILRAPGSGLLLKTEVVTVINSLAKGQAAHTASLVQAGVLPVLWEQLEACGVQGSTSQYLSKVTFTDTSDTGSISDEPINISAGQLADRKEGRPSNEEYRKKLLKIVFNYTQMLLCCLRSIYRQGCVPPPPSWNHKMLSTLIKYGYHPPTNQECVANILAYACKSTPTVRPEHRHTSVLRLLSHHTAACEEQQKQLVEAGAGQLVASMIRSSLTTVQLPALHCLTALAKNNAAVSKEVARISHCGMPLPDRLVELLSCHTELAVQLAAATALVWLHRGGALSHSDPRIQHKTLQCLIRLCASDRPTWLRVEAARELAHVTERSEELQAAAAITDHLIPTLKDFLCHTPSENEQAPKPEYLSPSSCGQFDEPELLCDLMCEAALLVYAALAANNEVVRQKVVKGQGLIECICSKLETGTPALKLAAVRCLHSLTRSVHTLRTTFQDNNVWHVLVTILEDPSADDELTVSALCVVSNLSLQFSLSKEHLLKSDIIAILAKFTKSENFQFKYNALWGLMNIAYQDELSVKETILKHLTVDEMFNLVSTNNVNLVCKTLGLLRNLLSPKHHIDSIMSSNSNAVLQIIIWLLEGSLCADVKEQALCVLVNIANGEKSKEVLIGNDDILKKLFNYMRLQAPSLQTAATMCVGNLADTSGPNPLERQLRLREARIEKALEGLLSTPNAALYDKVKYALDMFKCISSASSTVSLSTMTTTSPSIGSNSASNGSSSASSTPGPNWRSSDSGP